MSDLKTKQIFSEPRQGSFETPSLTAQQQFSAQEKFVPMNMEDPAEEAFEVELDTIIRPAKGANGLPGACLRLSVVWSHGGLSIAWYKPFKIRTSSA